MHSCLYKAYLAAAQRSVTDFESNTNARALILLVQTSWVMCTVSFTIKVVCDPHSPQLHAVCMACVLTQDPAPVCINQAVHEYPKLTLHQVRASVIFVLCVQSLHKCPPQTSMSSFVIVNFCKMMSCTRDAALKNSYMRAKCCTCTQENKW